MAEFVPFSGQLDSQGNAGFVQFSGQLDDPAKPMRQRTMTEEFQRQLGLAGRAAVTGLTGTAGIIGDAVAGGANLLGAAGEKLGLPAPTKLGSPSQGIQDAMSKVGVPNAENPMEKGVNFLSSALAGAGDPVLRATQAATAQAFPAPAVTAVAPQISKVTKELHDAGYKLPPSRMEGTGPARTLEGFAGKTAVAEELSAKNQPLTNELARKALNLPKDTPLTAEVLEANVKQLVDKGYAPLQSVPYVGVGAKYRQALADIFRDYGGGSSFPLAQREVVKAEVNKYLYKPDPNMGGLPRYIQSYTGEDALRAIQNLRTEASANFNKGDNLLALTQRRIATALEENVELTLSNSPRYAKSGILESFREARKGIAKTEAVKDMLVDPATGIVSTGKAQALLRQGTPLTDELRTIANAGSPMYGPATLPPTRGAALPLNYGGTGTGLGAGAMVGLLSGKPALGAAAASIPVARAGARGLIASPWYQSGLADNLGAAPGYLMTPPGQRSLAAAPEGLLPLFTQGQQ